MERTIELVISLQHYDFGERGCRVENKSSPTRPHRLESENWVTQAQK